MKKLGLKELGRLTPEAFRTQVKSPFVLVLDNIRSGLNVGSAFRTADAFALEKIKLCGITAQPPHREILKTAIGATETIPWSYHENSLEAINSLKSESYVIVGVEQAKGSVLLPDFEIDRHQKYALVFGNEVTGIGEQAMGQLDCCIEVPQFGTKHSLNVGVCIGLVVWELFRQWKYPSLSP